MVSEVILSDQDFESFDSNVTDIFLNFCQDLEPKWVKNCLDFPKCPANVFDITVFNKCQYLADVIGIGAKSWSVGSIGCWSVDESWSWWCCCCCKWFKLSAEAAADARAWSSPSMSLRHGDSWYGTPSRRFHNKNPRKSPMQRPRIAMEKPSPAMDPAV